MQCTLQLSGQIHWPCFISCKDMYSVVLPAWLCYTVCFPAYGRFFFLPDSANVSLPYGRFFFPSWFCYTVCFLAIRSVFFLPYSAILYVSLTYGRFFPPDSAILYVFPAIRSVFFLPDSAILYVSLPYGRFFSFLILLYCMFPCHTVVFSHLTLLYCMFSLQYGRFFSYLILLYCMFPCNTVGFFFLPDSAILYVFPAIRSVNFPTWLCYTVCFPAMRSGYFPTWLCYAAVDWVALAGCEEVVEPVPRHHRLQHLQALQYYRPILEPRMPIIMVTEQ